MMYEESKKRVWELTNQLDIALGKIQYVGEYHYGQFRWETGTKGVFIGEATHEWDSVDSPSDFLDEALTECFNIKAELVNLTLDGSSHEKEDWRDL